MIENLEVQLNDLEKFIEDENSSLGFSEEVMDKIINAIKTIKDGLEVIKESSLQDIFAYHYLENLIFYLGYNIQRITKPFNDIPWYAGIDV